MGVPERWKRRSAVGVLASGMFLAAGCAGLLVDAKLHTQSGITVACRVSPSPRGVNLVQLDGRVTSTCTSGDVPTEVLREGTALGAPGKWPKVIYEGQGNDVTTDPFPLPPAGSMLTVVVTAICDHAGVRKTGSDTCQIGK